VSIPSFLYNPSNAKSPDVPGGVDIARGAMNVSISVPEKKDVDAAHKAGHDEGERS
jgi:hypothetical protein